MKKNKIIFLGIVILALSLITMFIITNNSKKTIAKKTIENYLIALSNKNLDELNNSTTSNSQLKYTNDDIKLLTKILKTCELKTLTITNSTSDTMDVNTDVLINCYDTPDAEIGDWSAGSNTSTKNFILKKTDGTWKVDSWNS